MIRNHILYAADAAPAGASRAVAPIDEVRHNLTQMQSQFKMALPAHIDPEKFTRVAVTAAQNNPDLVQADRRSLYGACMKAAQDGLLPDGKEAALVIFNTKVKNAQGQETWVKSVQYMPMIAGILKKVRNSGELSTITSGIIHKADKFDYWVDSDGEHMDYRPLLLGERGPILGAFAMAKLTDGALYVEVMSITEIQQVREVSRAKDSGPWKSWWSEMARKTVMRRLCKRLPMSTDLDQVFSHDDEGFDMGAAPTPAAEPVDITPAAPKAPRRQAARAAAAVGGEAQGRYTVEEIPEHREEGQAPIAHQDDGMDLGPFDRSKPSPAQVPSEDEVPL